MESVYDETLVSIRVGLSPAVIRRSALGTGVGVESAPSLPGPLGSADFKLDFAGSCDMPRRL